MDQRKVVQRFTVGDVASVSLVRQAVAGSEACIAAAMRLDSTRHPQPPVASKVDPVPGQLDPQATLQELVRAEVSAQLEVLKKQLLAEFVRALSYGRGI